jgi:hypothetical protein
VLAGSAFLQREPDFGKLSVNLDGPVLGKAIRIQRQVQSCTTADDVKAFANTVPRDNSNGVALLPQCSAIGDQPENGIIADNR